MTTLCLLTTLEADAAPMLTLLSLWLHQVPQQASMHLTACNCPPAGSFVRFQPQTADFQRQVGPDIETVLEQALLTRSTLTEGDWVSVAHADRQYDLRVQGLRPAGQVSVIGMAPASCLPALRCRAAHPASALSREGQMCRLDTA